MDIRSWKFLAKAIIITFLLASCGAKPAALPTVMPTLKVVQAQKPTYTVQRGDIQEQVRLTGHIHPESQATVSFRIGGRVKGVYGKVGDKVTKGQLLADLEEADTLLSAQTVKKMELRRVEIGLEMAQLNLEAFQAQPLTDYQKQFDVPRLKYLVELAQIDLDLARLKAGDFNAQVEDYQVIAPQDGEIIRLDVTEGQSVTALTPAVTIADTSRLLILMQPDQDVARNLAVGTPVTYDTKNAPDKIYAAKITAIPEASTSTADTASNSFQIQIDSLPEGADLSDFVNVTVLLVDKPASLWLPPQAVRVFEGREYVITKEDESQHRVDILTGMRTADKVEILEGLEEGMLVVGP